MLIFLTNLVRRSLSFAVAVENADPNTVAYTSPKKDYINLEENGKDIKLYEDLGSEYRIYLITVYKIHTQTTPTIYLTINALMHWNTCIPAYLRTQVNECQ